MSKDTKINDSAITAAIKLSELDFSKNVGASANSTFKWRRKKKVLGQQEVLPEDPTRYDILPSE